MNKNLTAILICLALTACQDGGITMPKGSLWSHISSLWSSDETPTAHASAPLATSQLVATSQPVAEKSPSIEVLAEQKIKQQINALNKQGRKDDEATNYTLDAQNIIRVDMNRDGINDYVVEATFSYSPPMSNSQYFHYSIWIFTVDEQQNNHFTADTHQDVDTKLTNIDMDGVIHLEQYDYAETDPRCCPSIRVEKLYVLHGNKLVAVSNT